MRLLGLSGYAGAGKDVAAAALVQDGWQRLAFADLLREALARLNPTIVTGRTTTPLTLLVGTLGWDVAKRKYPEVRTLLQRMGTEVGREMFGVNFWVDQLFKDLDREGSYVVSDVRFPSELHGIRDRGGKIARVHRLGIGPVNAHPSETALDDEVFDFNIWNESTVSRFTTDIRAAVNSAWR